MSRVKISSRDNLIILDFPGVQNLYFGVDGDLSASSSSNKVTIKDSGSGKVIYAGDYRNIGGSDGTQLASSASATVSALTALFDAVNPANYADKTELDNLKAVVRASGSGRGVRFDVNDDESARVEVLQDVAKISTRGTKVSVDDSSGAGEALISVRSNTNNTPEVVDAIKVNGTAGNATSSVEILGTLRVNGKVSTFLVDNTASSSVSITAGNTQDLTISSANTTYENKLINGNVTVGTNAVSVRGLSTGDGVRVEAVFNIDTSGTATLSLSPSSGTFTNTSIADSNAGSRDVTLSSVCTVHDGSVGFAYDINSFTLGSYKLKTLNVTIT